MLTITDTHMISVFAKMSTDKYFQTDSSPTPKYLHFPPGSHVRNYGMHRIFTANKYSDSIFIPQKLVYQAGSADLSLNLLDKRINKTCLSTIETSNMTDFWVNIWIYGRSTCWAQQHMKEVGLHHKMLGHYRRIGRLYCILYVKQESKVMLKLNAYSAVRTFLSSNPKV